MFVETVTFHLALPEACQVAECYVGHYHGSVFVVGHFRVGAPRHEGQRRSADYHVKHDIQADNIVNHIIVQ